MRFTSDVLHVKPAVRRQPGCRGRIRIAGHIIKTYILTLIYMGNININPISVNMNIYLVKEKGQFVIKRVLENIVQIMKKL